MAKKDPTPLNLLTGTVVKTEKGYFYIKNKLRIHIPTKNVVKSWRFYKVVKTNEQAVSHYPVLGTLGFREGTFVYCIADANYYIVSDKKMVHVTDMQTVYDHGLRPWNALVISKKERDLHERTE